MKLLNLVSTKYFRMKYIITRLGLCGSNVSIHQDTYIAFPESISIKDNVYIGPGGYIAAYGGLRVGSNVIIGPKVNIHTSNHNYRSKHKTPYDEINIRKLVSIADSCWIGANVSILPGISIGEGSIVAMGSVVTKNVDSYSIVSGNPATVVSQRDSAVYDNLKKNRKLFYKDRSIPKHNKFKAALCGAYGESNFGDDLLMICLHSVCRKVFLVNEVIIFVAESNDPGYVPFLLDNVVTGNEMSDIECDTLILGGGTHFFRFQYSTRYVENLINSIWVAVNRSKRISKVIRRILNGNGIKYENKMAVSVGLGPFERNISIKQLEDLKENSLLQIRDSRSYDLCSSYGVNNCLLRTDIVYNHELWIELGKVECESKKKITIILRDWSQTKIGAQHSSIIIDNTSLLKDRFPLYEFNYVLFSSNRDAKCEKLLIKNNEEYLKWDPYRYTVIEFIDQFSDSEMIISSRFHGLVVASVLNIPSVAVGIDPKLSDLGRGLEDTITTWKKPFHIVELIEIIELYIFDRGSRRRKLAEAVGVMNGISKTMETELINILSK